jgi:hypothetical protein
MTGPMDGESYVRAALTYLAEPADLRLASLVRTYGATDRDVGPDPRHPWEAHA